MKKRHIYSLVAGVFLVSLTVGTMAIGTYAWFLAAPATITPTSYSTGNATATAPASSTFYYFKGNGTPGTDSYTGYSKSDATFGNKTNMVNTSTNKFTLDGTNYSDLLAIPGAGDSYNNACWGKIDVSSATSVNNCLNLTRMRPGCYYTFCVIYSSAGADLELTFAESVTGNNKTPKRRVYNGGVTTSPISLAMALNGYAAISTTSQANVRSYFSTTFTQGATKANDKINFNYASPSYVYPFINNGATNGANACVFFTVYMGSGNKADALLYHSKAGTGASEILYYQLNQTSGDYSALDGLSLSISRLEVKDHSS